VARRVIARIKPLQKNETVTEKGESRAVEIRLFFWRKARAEGKNGTMKDTAGAGKGGSRAPWRKWDAHRPSRCRAWLHYNDGHVATTT